MFKKLLSVLSLSALFSTLSFRAKSDFNDVASVANPKRKEFLALTATKTITIGLF